VTVLLREVAGGDSGAMQRLMEIVHHELVALARARMKGERSDHTLQPTALVHEAYLRLLQSEPIGWEGKAHFFRAAAQAMRRILIDHARSKNALKRGDGGRTALGIATVSEAFAQEDGAGLLALDEAMERLALSHPTAAEIVRLKFYSGLDDAAVAQVLSTSDRTVRREWAFARGWLRDRLERDAREQSP
jgi:RNA polymerase sigma factor (TIGR02999 family)